LKGEVKLDSQGEKNRVGKNAEIVKNLSTFSRKSPKRGKHKLWLFLKKRGGGGGGRSVVAKKKTKGGEELKRGHKKRGQSQEREIHFGKEKRGGVFLQIGSSENGQKGGN